MSEHSKEAVEAYPDNEFAQNAVLLAFRDAFDRGLAAGKATQFEGDREKVRSVILEYMPGADGEPDSRGIVDALFASGIIKQAPPKYVGPPDGWFEFGSHAGGFDGPLEFSTETDDSGMPKWERHPEKQSTPIPTETGSTVGGDEDE